MTRTDESRVTKCHIYSPQLPQFERHSRTHVSRAYVSSRVSLYRAREIVIKPRYAAETIIYRRTDGPKGSGMRAETIFAETVS